MKQCSKHREGQQPTHQILSECCRNEFVSISDNIQWVTALFPSAKIRSKVYDVRNMIPQKLPGGSPQPHFAVLGNSSWPGRDVAGIRAMQSHHTPLHTPRPGHDGLPQTAKCGSGEPPGIDMVRHGQI